MNDREHELNFRLLYSPLLSLQYISLFRLIIWYIWSIVSSKACLKNEVGQRMH